MEFVLDSGEEVVSLKFGCCAVIVCVKQTNGKKRRITGIEAEEIYSLIKKETTSKELERNGIVAIQGLPQRDGVWPPRH
ncbi:MAG: hypothetical protein Q7R92_02455 [bacterium]|nr:hypothetical protein [bacterium]